MKLEHPVVEDPTERLNDKRKEIEELQARIRFHLEQVEMYRQRAANKWREMHTLMMTRHIGERVKLRYRHRPFEILAQFNDRPGILMEVEGDHCRVEWDGSVWTLPIDEIGPIDVEQLDLVD